MNRMVKKFMVVLLSAFMFLGAVTTPVQAEGDDYYPTSIFDWIRWWQQPQPEESTEPAPEETPAETEEPSEETKEETPATGETAEVTEPSQETTPVTDEAQVDAGVEETPVVEDLSYPAAILVPEQQLDNITVTVDAPEGALPEGTTLEVAEVSLEDVQAAVDAAADISGTVLTAVDITFYDANGVKIEPTEGSEVKVSITAPEIAETENVEIVHIPDEAEPETIDQVDEDQTAEDEVAFISDSFSIYAVIGGNTNDDARATVYFYGYQGSEVAKYYVKNSDVILGDGAREDDKSYLEDIVTDPGIGGVLPSGYLFTGWYIGESADYQTTTDPKTIEDVRKYLEALEITEGDEVKVYAMIFKVYSVTYLDESGVSMGSDDIYLTERETVADYTVSRTYTPKSLTQNFIGWQADNDSMISDAEYEGEPVSQYYKMDTTMKISGSIVFRPQAPNGRWLVFDENGKGATYNAPQFVKDGETTTSPTLEMVRLGYTFVGWYTEKYADNEPADESKRFNFGSELTQDSTTIYAKWTANARANYTVIYWKQDVAGTDDEGKNIYNFDHSQTIEGNVGDTISVTEANGVIRVTGANNYTIPKGFKYGKADSGKTVTPEGNTVVNVYIDRDKFTLKFQVYGYTYTESTNDNDNNPAKYGIIDGQYARVYWNNGAFRTSNSRYGTVYTGTVYTRSNNQSWQTIKEITALYEQNIADNFPIVGTNGVTYNNGERWKPQDNNLGWELVMVFVETMPNESVDFHLDTAQRPLKTMNYYIEALPSDTDTVTRNGVRYTLYNTIAARYNGVSTEDFVALDGFEKVAAAQTINGQALTPDGSGFYIYDENSNQTINFFYSRLKYSINFMDAVYVDGNGNRLDDYDSIGQWTKVENVIYGSDVSSYNKGGANYYVPECKYPGFVFEGWYVDDACTTPYTFGTLPKGGITVYAKWRQIQYRVFLHPNAKLPDGTNDSSLNWGSDEQEMNFRISYRGKVSIPTGTRDEYDFIGWFKDEAGTQPFNVAGNELTEDTVTADYDKTDSKNYTDKMNKYGEIEGQGWNSDLIGWDHDNDESTPGIDRFWIEKKLDLYGKWSARLTGANGIGVLYVADPGSGAPSDNRKYADNVSAIAQAASAPPADKVFLYWVVQDWDEDAGAYVDTDTHVYPGATFTVLKSLAKETDLSGDDIVYETDDEGNLIYDDEGNLIPLYYKAYTMQLRAEYGDKNTPKPTHIEWYKNDKEGSELLNKDNGLQINEAVTIYTLKEGKTIPERTGYKFLGWARESEVNADTGATITYYPELSENDLFLKYDAANNKYQAQNEAGEWVDVTQIAADEILPYQALYAVWEHKYFYVFHSSNATLEAIAVPETETFSIVNKTNDGFLYGGYYSAYVNLNANSENIVAAKAEALKVTDKTATVENAPTYDGRTLKPEGSSVKFWVKTNAYTEAKLGKGDSIPVNKINDGDVFFLKEVPDTYLNAYFTYVYNYNTYAVSKFYLLTGIDDTYYSSVGYYVTANDYVAKISASFSYKRRNDSDLLTKIKPQDVFNITRGYFGVCDAENLLSNLPEGAVATTPYWVTLDGVEITNKKVKRTVKFSADQREIEIND